MLNNFKKYLKLSILIFGISIFLVKCQKDDIQKIDSKEQSQKVTSKIVTGKDIPSIIDFIKSRSNEKLQFTIRNNNTSEEMMRDDTDNIILTTVLTDYINQVSINDVSNYAFEMEEIENDTDYFLNLVVKEYNDSYYISIVKYVPDPRLSYKSSN